MFKNHSKGTAKLPNCIYLLYLWWRTQQCMVSTNKCHLAAQSSDPTCFLQLLEHKIVKLTPKMNKNDMTWKNGTSFKPSNPPPKIFQPKPMAPPSPSFGNREAISWWDVGHQNGGTLWFWSLPRWEKQHKTGHIFQFVVEPPIPKNMVVKMRIFPK